MIYFDNAATGGRKPDSVLTAVFSSVKVCANAGRSGHKLSLSCSEKVLKARQILSDYFDGYGFERVAFTKNCTEALNLALFGVLQKGDHVITTCMEHNSVLRALEELKTDGVEVDVCPLENGKISPKTFCALQKENTKMAVITTASNVNGSLPPLSKIRDGLRKDILFVLDGAQGGGHIPLSMRSLSADALALAGHKGLFGIQGSGALLFSERFFPTPRLFGGTGSESYSLTMPEFYPDRLEAGTLCFPAVSSLYEGIRFLEMHDTQIRKKLLLLTTMLCERLSALPFYDVYSEPNPCGIVAFASKEIPSEMLSQILSDEFGFAVRGGLHCAPLMHQALGTAENGLVRASFSHFNTRAEIAEFSAVLKRIASEYGKKKR